MHVKALGQTIPIIFTIAALISTGFVVNANSQEDEGLVSQYISECRNAAQNEIDSRGNPYLTQDLIDQMAQLLSNCDNNVLYYENQCQTDPSKIFCTNAAMEEYIVLRGLANPRP